MAKPVVAVLMGSESDRPRLEGASVILEEMGIPFVVEVMSAHRSPQRVSDFAGGAAERGLKVLIAGAGMANHLAGAVAARTILPVIGVPLDASPLQGLDSLMSTVQMPPGVPVATVAVGGAGAKNAAWLAAEILALGDAELAARLREKREAMGG